LRWIWDTAKNRRNERIHRLSFETAIEVFNDPLSTSQPDPHEGEERWQTVGMIGDLVVFVVHTSPERDATGEEIGRIISARKATPHERKAYEEDS